MKKLLLIFATSSSILAPVTFAISCNEEVETTQDSHHNVPHLNKEEVTNELKKLEKLELIKQDNGKWIIKTAAELKTLVESKDDINDFLILEVTAEKGNSELAFDVNDLKSGNILTIKAIIPDENKDKCHWEHNSKPKPSWTLTI